MGNAPVRATQICNLRIDKATIPIKTFRGFDEVGLSGELFHDGCDGKIRQATHCELHPDLDFPATYSAIKVGTEYFRLDREDRKELLGKNNDFRVVSSHKLTLLGNLLSGKQIVPYGIYQIAPQEGWEEVLASLFQRLSAKKRFLLLTGPIGIERYSILLPDGTLLPLLYQEEIRLPKFNGTKAEAKLFKPFDAAIMAYERDFPRISALNILRRIDAWKAPLINARTVDRVKAGLKPVQRVGARLKIKEKL